VRVSANSAAIPDARSAREATALLRRIVELPRHVFWSDDTAAVEDVNQPFARVVGYRQITDAHLLALAMRRGGRLATFDPGIRDLVPRGMDPGTVVDSIG
jgi:hypothetical protein